jgi:hypothetical protein
MINRLFITASLLTFLGVPAVAQTVTSPTAPLVPRVDCTLPANAELLECLSLPDDFNGVTNYAFVVGPLAGLGALAGLAGGSGGATSTTSTTSTD